MAKKDHPHRGKSALHESRELPMELSGMFRKKRDLLEKALKMFEACYGEKDHPDVATTLQRSRECLYSSRGCPQTREIFSRRP